VRMRGERPALQSIKRAERVVIGGGRTSCIRSTTRQALPAFSAIAAFLFRQDVIFGRPFR
jgi:hypothetical protein